MEAAVYLLGMFVALACGLLLARGYKQSRQRLLLWSSICFLGLALSGALTFLDLSVLPPAIDLHMVRRHRPSERPLTLYKHASPA